MRESPSVDIDFSQPAYYRRSRSPPSPFGSSRGFALVLSFAPAGWFGIHRPHFRASIRRAKNVCQAPGNGGIHAPRQPFPAATTPNKSRGVQLVRGGWGERGEGEGSVHPKSGSTADLNQRKNRLDIHIFVLACCQSCIVHGRLKHVFEGHQVARQSGDRKRLLVRHHPVIRAAA